MMQRTATDRSLVSRMMRAAQFDSNLYEQVERDVDATSQAALVVVIVSIATGIGLIGSGGILGLLLGVVGGLITWVLWSAIAYWVGKSIFATPNTRVTLGEMLRTLGFAHVPGVLFVFLFVPVLGPLIAVAAAIWMLVLGVIAVRQAMDFTTGRAIGTVLVGAIPFLIVRMLLAAIGL
jgi:hypothetical protein